MSEFSERYGPWALVTGASAGIGAEFGRQLASRGLNVVLVARRLDRLQSLANELSRDFGVETRTISANLSSSEPLDALLREIKGLEIGLLVNNAGVGTHGAFMESELGSELAILDLNCRAPMALAHALGSAMLARGRGGLIFVSSVFGFFPVPMMGTYAASKAYDLFFAEALAEELDGSGVDVMALCPGLTRTEFFEVADLGGRWAWLIDRLSMRCEGVGITSCVFYTAGKY
jgi:short-subunit dehydrogenase